MGVGSARNMAVVDRTARHLDASEESALDTTLDASSLGLLC